MAGKDYWNENWKDTSVADCVDPLLPGLNNYVNSAFHVYFKENLTGFSAGSKLLEIGCARSAWLPYFAKNFSFAVSGLDYSEVGCELAGCILENNGINASIFCADFFSPPPEISGIFDVVVSFGVAEHFEDTEACINAFSAFLKPRGRIITVVPNMYGLVGILQKWFDREVYDKHFILGRKLLEQAHRKSFTVQHCDYFLPANFNVINTESIKNRHIYMFWRRIFSVVSKFFWVIEPILPGFLRRNRFFSPYIICVADKK